jgi:hypothetical protein
VLVAVEDRQPFMSFTGTTDFLKAAFLPGLRGALLALDGE